MKIDKEQLTLDYSSGSDDGGEEEHARLLTAISKLDKRKRVLPSERREPSLQVSEFHLSKESSTDTNTVHLRDLAKSLNLGSSHGEIARKLKSAQRKAKTLPKPLEKPAANKIKREVAFENVKEDLSQWDPVVFCNRVSDDLVFPLKTSKAARLNPKDFLSPDQGATELEREIAAVLDGSPSVQKEREEKEEFPLSLEEMIQRRKELARLRAQESYRQAKAHRQNKIKSKKFHRFARRERIRKQIKEFEELQQKDPEAALQRLEEIEKERALERVSLRHRSTGQWARSQAVRAKYDKESRQVLSEQLKLSKELTKKIQVESESSDDEPADIVDSAPSDNPWISQTKSEAEVDVFLSGYRKYWVEKSKAAQEKVGSENVSSVSTMQPTKEAAKIDQVEIHNQKSLCENAVESYSEIQSANVQEISLNGNHKSTLQVSGPAIKKAKAKKIAKKAVEDSSEKKKRPAVISSGGNWIVTSLETSSPSNSKSIDFMFDDLSEKISEKAKKKISNMKKELEDEEQRKLQVPKKKKSSKRKKEARTSDNSSVFQMKKQKLTIDVDEKLEESSSTSQNGAHKSSSTEHLAETVQEHSRGNKVQAPELDPNKFIKAGPIKLQTELPDEVTGGDEGLDDSDVEGREKEKYLTISEAFADDDVVADFSQEKQDAIEKSKPEDINLHLPGWGEWAGHNMKPNKRKNRRFMVKMPEPPPRRDQNKGNLIVNESEDSAARAHQVVDLPFPFTSVKDFEASMRAPISNTFIPESAHRKLIKPSVRTKMGAIITPIEKDVLVKRSKSEK